MVRLNDATVSVVFAPDGFKPNPMVPEMQLDLTAQRTELLEQMIDKFLDFFRRFFRDSDLDRRAGKMLFSARCCGTTRLRSCTLKAALRT